MRCFFSGGVAGGFSPSASSAASGGGTGEDGAGAGSGAGAPRLTRSRILSTSVEADELDELSELDELVFFLRSIGV